MSVFVVDASVAAKWFFMEEHKEEALGLLGEPNILHAPVFFLIDVDNIVCKRIRRKQISEKEGRVVRAALRRFPVQYHPFSLLLDSAFSIANRTHCSMYDCLYVALAALLDARMVTADRRLCDALAGGPFEKHVLWVGDMP